MKKLITILLILCATVASAQIGNYPLTPGNVIPQVNLGKKITELGLYIGNGLDSALIPVVIGGVNRKAYGIDLARKRLDSLVAAVNAMGGSGVSGAALSDTLLDYRVRLNELTVLLNAKQAALVSGTSIKTVNGSTLLGSGNLVVTGADTTSLSNRINQTVKIVDTPTVFTDYRNAINGRATVGQLNLANIRVTDSAAMIINQIPVDPSRGLAADSTINSTTSVQAALNTGKDVNLNGQTYKVSAVSLTKNGQRLFNGRLLGSDTTVAVVNVSGLRDCLIQNLSIKTVAGRTSIGIKVINSVGVILQYNTVTNFGSSGLSLAGGDSACVLYKNSFYNAASDYIFSSPSSSDITISGSNYGCIVRENFCRSGGGYAVNIKTSANGEHNDGHQVIGNDIYGYNSYGIMLYRNAQILADVPQQSVANATIAWNTVRKISGARPSDAAVPGTLIFGAGIYLQGAENTTVQNNTIDSTNLNTNNELLAPGSIGLANVGQATISGNSISGSAQYGIYFNDANSFGLQSGKITLTGNTIRKITLSGLKSNKQANIVATNNIIYDVANGLLFQNASGDVRGNYLVTSNQITKTSSAGINFVYSKNIRAVANQIDSTTTHGFSLSNSSAFSLTNNEVRAATSRGFDIGSSNTGSNSLINNYVGNSSVGYLLNAPIAYSGNVSVSNSTAYSGTAINFTNIGTSATPDVQFRDIVTLAPASPTTITNFTNGTTDQILKIQATNGNATLQHGSNIVLSGAINHTMASNEVMTFLKAASGWIEISRSVAQGTLQTITDAGATTTNTVKADRLSIRSNISSPIYTLSIGSTGNGWAVHNQPDDSTNYEVARGFWTSNIFSIQTNASGTGTQRGIQMLGPGARGIKIGQFSGARGLVTIDAQTISSGNASGFGSIVNATNSSNWVMSASHGVYGNQTGTAATIVNDNWLYPRTLGSGRQYLFVARTTSDSTGNTLDSSRFKVTIDTSGKVSIGGAFSSKALLELNSTTKGFLLPRLTTTQVTAFVPDSLGMMVWNRTTVRPNVYTGVGTTGWQPLITGINLHDSLAPIRALIGTKMLLVNDTNVNAVANSLENIDGLLFSVDSGRTYSFKFVIFFDAAATTTGARFTLAGPAKTMLMYSSSCDNGPTTLDYFAGRTSYNDATITPTATSNLTANKAVIEGVIRVTATSVVIPTFSSEVSSSAIIAQVGSYVEYKLIN